MRFLLISLILASFSVRSQNIEPQLIQTELANLELLLKDYDQSSALTMKEIEASIKGVSIGEKLTSEKVDFYRCLKDTFKSTQVINVGVCRNFFKAKFSRKEEDQLAEWQRKHSSTKDQIISRQQYLKRNIAEYKQQTLNQEMKNNFLKKDEEVLKNNRIFLNCNASTPTINLEDKTPYPGAKFEGPFNKIPRDNQDGLGTCFANTAKNLLVGLSRGQDNASFMDMALAYKQDNDIISSGLEGGHSCLALKSIEEQGYCPQYFSPLERGQGQPLPLGLVSTSSNNLYEQAKTIGLLNDFLKGQAKLDKSNKALSEEILKRSRLIIERIKTNPEIKLPLPVVRHPIPSDFSLKVAYYNNKDKMKISEETFMQEYKNAYKGFYPEYLNAVMAGKSSKQIFEIYKSKMGLFLKTYHLESSLEEFKKSWMLEVKQEIEDPDLGKSLLATLKLIREVSNKEEAAHEEFIDYCTSSLYPGMEFLSTFQPLLEHLDALKVDASNLYDEHGKLRNPRELMQLAIAPSCLNESNRKKTDFGIHCEDGYNFIGSLKEKSEDEKVQAVREKVVASLLQGYPLGNAFKNYENHINTIVGLRFNQSSGKCQYLIRESQTGTSIWQDEGAIVSKIQALTEVRRK